MTAFAVWVNFSETLCHDQILNADVATATNEDVSKPKWLTTKEPTLAAAVHVLENADQVH